MSCGLGAIILVFMLVKHNVDKSSLEEELLQNDLDRLAEQKAQLSDQLDAVLQTTEEKRKAVAKKAANLKNIESKINQTAQEVARQSTKIKRLKQAIEKAPPARKADKIEHDPGGEENYLMGLKVEGSRIAFLLDSSASMTDEKLIDVIRRKNASDKTKQSGPKWRRAKRVVKWLMARLPKNARFAVLAFNKKVQVLGGGTGMLGQNSQSLGRVLKDLEEVVPEGPTNLHKGLLKAAQLNPTNLYLITDGLPTTGESSYASLNPFASCSSLLGSSSTISGECRVKLFRQTIKETASQLKGSANVILLPIEGDPEASPELWTWTAATGGLMISPAGSWP